MDNGGGGGGGTTSSHRKKPWYVYVQESLSSDDVRRQRAMNARLRDVASWGDEVRRMAHNSEKELAESHFAEIKVLQSANQTMEAATEKADLALESIAAVYNVLERKKQKKERQLAYIARDQRQMNELKIAKRKMAEAVWQRSQARDSRVSAEFIRSGAILSHFGARLQAQASALIHASTARATLQRLQDAELQLQHELAALTAAAAVAAVPQTAALATAAATPPPAAAAVLASPEQTKTAEPERVATAVSGAAAPSALPSRSTATAAGVRAPNASRRSGPVSAVTPIEPVESAEAKSARLDRERFQVRKLEQARTAERKALHAAREKERIEKQREAETVKLVIDPASKLIGLSVSNPAPNAAPHNQCTIVHTAAPSAAPNWGTFYSSHAPTLLPKVHGAQQLVELTQLETGIVEHSSKLHVLDRVLQGLYITHPALKTETLSLLTSLYDSHHQPRKAVSTTVVTTPTAAAAAPPISVALLLPAGGTSEFSAIRRILKYLDDKLSAHGYTVEGGTGSPAARFFEPATSHNPPPAPSTATSAGAGSAAPKPAAPTASSSAAGGSTLTPSSLMSDDRAIIQFARSVFTSFKSRVRSIGQYYWEIHPHSQQNTWIIGLAALSAPPAVAAAAAAATAIPPLTGPVPPAATATENGLNSAAAHPIAPPPPAFSFMTQKHHPTAASAVAVATGAAAPAPATVPSFGMCSDGSLYVNGVRFISKSAAAHTVPITQTQAVSTPAGSGASAAAAVAAASAAAAGGASGATGSSTTPGPSLTDVTVIGICLDLHAGTISRSLDGSPLVPIFGAGSRIFHSAEQLRQCTLIRRGGWYPTFMLLAPLLRSQLAHNRTHANASTAAAAAAKRAPGAPPVPKPPAAAAGLHIRTGSTDTKYPELATTAATAATATQSSDWDQAVTAFGTSSSSAQQSLIGFIRPQLSVNLGEYEFEHAPSSDVMGVDVDRYRAWTTSTSAIDHQSLTIEQSFNASIRGVNTLPSPAGPNAASAAGLLSTPQQATIAGSTLLLKHQRNVQASGDGAAAAAAAEQASPDAPTSGGDGGGSAGGAAAGASAAAAAATAAGHLLIRNTALEFEKRAFLDSLSAKPLRSFSRFPPAEVAIEHAACILQRAVRRYLGRRRRQHMRKKIDTSARVLQRRFRTIRTHQKVLKEKAAKRIQASTRGFVVRKSFKLLRGIAQRLGRSAVVVERAVHVVQRAIRRFLDERRIHRFAAAVLAQVEVVRTKAKMIQRAWRVWAARRKRALGTARMKAAALILQRCYRGMRARRALAKADPKFVALRQRMRGRRSKWRAILTVQRFVRGWKARQFAMSKKAVVQRAMNKVRLAHRAYVFRSRVDTFFESTNSKQQIKQFFGLLGFEFL